MLSDLSLAIELQDIDQRIAGVEREIAALPRHIALIEKTLDSHRRRLEADEAALAANGKERKKLEGDIQIQEQKRSKLRDQMMEAKTNEQLWAFQHEIEFCDQAIRKCEDRILELMIDSEPLEQNVRKAKTALEQENKQVETEKQQARDRTAEDQRLLVDLKNRRERAVAAITPAVYGIYEKQRKRKAVVAVAGGADGQCAGCQIAIRPQYFQELKQGDRVLQCENCGAILYYNPPPIAFDSDIAAPANGGQPVAR
ncbi:MAG: zinc ribbon domain-containing protein [Bryobacteraceae bacterium]